MRLLSLINGIETDLSSRVNECKPWRNYCLELEVIWSEAWTGHERSRGDEPLDLRYKFE
jgi:hypothetical protein